jgi:hypothetical protein
LPVYKDCASIILDGAADGCSGLVWTGALLRNAFEPAVLPSSSAFARGTSHAAILKNQKAFNGHAAFFPCNFAVTEIV